MAGPWADRWWTLVSPGYDRAVALVGWHRRLEELVADLPAGSTVCEVGCGPGYLAPLLVARGIGYVGVDRNAAMLARARRRLSRTGRSAPLVRADATALPFADGTFDVVVVSGTLGLLAVAARRRALHELARVVTAEVRMLEPVTRAGVPPRVLRSRVVALVRERPLEPAELSAAGLAAETVGEPVLAGVYSRVRAVRG